MDGKIISLENEATRLYKLLTNIIGSERFIVTFIDDNEDLRYIQGDADLHDLLAMKTYHDLEFSDIYIQSEHSEHENV